MSEAPKKQSNFNLQGAQFAGGLACTKNLWKNCPFINFQFKIWFKCPCYGSKLLF